MQMAVSHSRGFKQEVGQVIKAWCAVGLCPYSQPKEPDRFDSKGGNPNPVSPDNNNNLTGATPLGESTTILSERTPFGIHGLDWGIDANKPKLKISKLSIFPFDDKDYFRITSPKTPTTVEHCVIPSLAFFFTNNVNAKTYTREGTVVKTYTNASYFIVPYSPEAPGVFVISVEPAFPGQILDYDMEITYFQSFNFEKCVDVVTPEWELIRECINGDFKILPELEPVILDAPYRTKDKVPIKDYYFYYDGESPIVEIPVRIIGGNDLRAELTDGAGNIISVTDNVETTDEEKSCE